MELCCRTFVYIICYKRLLNVEAVYVLGVLDEVVYRLLLCIPCCSDEYDFTISICFWCYIVLFMT